MTPCGMPDPGVTPIVPRCSHLCRMIVSGWFLPAPESGALAPGAGAERLGPVNLPIVAEVQVHRAPYLARFAETAEEFHGSSIVSRLRA